MSTPANPLDKFVTYTYHFELYVATSLDDISSLFSIGPINLSTSPTYGTRLKSGPLLLINSIKDAHQIIDDVVFSYIGPSVNNNGLMIPDGSMVMRILEPNGVSFIEKLARALNTFEASNLNSLVWGIKIFFVGRTETNKIFIMPNPVLIPMNFLKISSTYTNRGGEHILHFVSMQNINYSQHNPANQQTGYCNKMITVNASTVKGALNNLIDQLNSIYNDIYVNEFSNSKNSKTLNYSINIPEDIDGPLDVYKSANMLTINSTTAISCTQDLSIVEWIFYILRGSTKLNAIVGTSLQGLKKEGHAGVKMLSVLPFIKYNKTTVDIRYDIMWYEGDRKKDKVYIFDFLFATPGKNVDVISFDITMLNTLAWFSNGKSSVNKNLVPPDSKQTPDSKSYSSANVVTPDTKSAALSIPPTKQLNQIPGLHGDIAFIPLTYPIDTDSGFSNIKSEAISNFTYMFSSIDEMHGATAPSLTFKIRGNLDLLQAGIIYPGSKKIPFGVTGPTWIKVNIKDQQGHQFFYTGKYNLISIENHFSQGVFTQNLHVMMMPADEKGTKVLGFDTNTLKNSNEPNLDSYSVPLINNTIINGIQLPTLIPTGTGGDVSILSKP